MTQSDATLSPAALIFDPANLANPYLIYQQLREVSPIAWEPSLNAWFLTRYADNVAVMSDPRFSAQRMSFWQAYYQEEAATLAPVFAVINDWMLVSDPPKHRRLRSLVSKAFTPRTIEAMRPHIQTLVDQLLDQVEAPGPVDLMTALAGPLPTIVIAEMLGVPVEDRAMFKRWSDDVASFIGNLNLSAEEKAQILRSALEMTEYFKGIDQRLRANPKDDLLSALALAEDGGDSLSEAELLANAILLLAAGNETTTNLIGNGTLALLRNPDQLAVLRDNPALIPHGIEELLRYDSPVQFTERTPAEPLELAGQTLEPGQLIFAVVGAANRDPAHFSDPDRLDVQRRDVAHLSFGHGPHFCLGAPLARLEGQIAFASLLQRFPGLELVDPNPPNRPNVGLRGLESLTLSVAPA